MRLPAALGDECVAARRLIAVGWGGRARARADKPTLLLRRTVGSKKDEYQMDRKSTSKGEVMSILESAGFSRSNPYYIVPQGRVSHLFCRSERGDQLADSLMIGHV